MNKILVRKFPKTSIVSSYIIIEILHCCTPAIAQVILSWETLGWMFNVTKFLYCASFTQVLSLQTSTHYRVWFFFKTSDIDLCILCTYHNYATWPHFLYVSPCDLLINANMYGSLKLGLFRNSNVFIFEIDSCLPIGTKRRIIKLKMYLNDVCTYTEGSLHAILTLNFCNLSADLLEETLWVHSTKSLTPSATNW